MASIGAIPIVEIVGSQITDDGKHALIKTAQPDGSEVTLAVPGGELFRFIDALALSATQAHQKAGHPANLRQVFDASWFDLGGDPATGTVVLSLTFGAGGTLSFRMTRAMAEQMRETLNVHLGGVMPQTPSTPRH